MTPYREYRCGRRSCHVLCKRRRCGCARADRRDRYHRPDTINTTTTKTTTGWAAGGGVEYGIDMHWSVKAEYLVLGFRGTCRVARRSAVSPWGPSTAPPLTRLRSKRSLSDSTTASTKNGTFEPRHRVFERAGPGWIRGLLLYAAVSCFGAALSPMTPIRPPKPAARRARRSGSVHGRRRRGGGGMRRASNDGRSR